MEHGSAGRVQLPLLAGRRDVQRWSDKQPRAAFGFLRFPEAFEIFADALDADRYRRSGFPRPADARDQVHGVAVLGERLLKQRVAVQAPALRFASANDS